MQGTRKMLILYRLEHESINIGDDILIKVFEIEPAYRKGYVARIGVQAPKELKIWRTEIYEKILKERKLTEDIKNGIWHQQSNFSGERWEGSRD
jgi:carbon storage regulator